MTSPAGDVQQLSFGESLRRERELRRIDLRDVSEATKINIRYLEALERNEFTYLPAGAFTRGFIRSYARFIGTDESEMITAYLYEIGRQERVDPRKGGSRDVARDLSRDARRGALRAVQPDASSRRSRVIVVVSVVAALILTAVAAVLVPRLLDRPATSGSSTGPSSDATYGAPTSVPRG